MRTILASRERREDALHAAVRTGEHTDSDPWSSTSRPAGPAGRRSVPHLLLGVLLVLACAVGSLAVTLQFGGSRLVLATARAVTVGQVLTAADVRQVSLPADSDVRAVDASAAPTLVGRPVAVALPAGALLTPESLGGAGAPPPGQAIVAVALDPGRLPLEVASGDQVVVAPAPAGGAVAADRTVPRSWPAVVTSVVPSDTGQLTVVSYSLPRDPPARSPPCRRGSWRSCWSQRAGERGAGRGGEREGVAGGDDAVPRAGGVLARPGGRDRRRGRPGRGRRRDAFRLGTVARAAQPGRRRSRRGRRGSRGRRRGRGPAVAARAAAARGRAGRRVPAGRRSRAWCSVGARGAGPGGRAGPGPVARRRRAPGRGAGGRLRPGRSGVAGDAAAAVGGRDGRVDRRARRRAGTSGAADPGDRGVVAPSGPAPRGWRALDRRGGPRARGGPAGQVPFDPRGAAVLSGRRSVLRWHHSGPGRSLLGQSAREIADLLAPTAPVPSAPADRRSKRAGRRRTGSGEDVPRDPSMEGRAS